jgi:hypothetical protein
MRTYNIDNKKESGKIINKIFAQFKIAMHVIEVRKQHLLSSGGLFSVESIPGRAAATRRNN